MIDELKKNINLEIRMLREAARYIKKFELATSAEKKLLSGAINSLVSEIKIINESIPGMVGSISIAKKLPALPEKKPRLSPEMENIKFRKEDSEIEVVLRARDKEKFLKELNIGEQFIKKLKKRGYLEKEKYDEFKASRGYLKLANRLFLNAASNSVKHGNFKELNESLRKANIDILFESYVAMIYLSVFLSLIVSVFAVVLLLFFNTLPIWPFFELNTANILSRFIKVFWIPFAIPVLVFLGLYFYPSTEQKSIEKRIDQELPFAVIHMSAISGSGIEPSEIFKIIGLSREYPNLRREIRKILNQINLYGYDLTTALNNSSKTAPSEKLSELFSGLATTITSGANLSEFFEKRAETLLLSYQMERQKYTRLVETFLDIYISIVIAAPMIFLLLLIMMAISGINLGLTPFQISIMSVFIIGLLNFVFLIFLQMRQPSY